MGRERGPPGDKKPATAWCSGRSRSRPFSVVAGAVTDKLKAWPALLLVGWRLSADSGPSRPHPGTGGFDPKRSLERVGAPWRGPNDPGQHRHALREYARPSHKLGGCHAVAARYRHPCAHPRNSDWDRGTPRDATPPPPPGIRVRTTAVRLG